MTDSRKFSKMLCTCQRCIAHDWRDAYQQI